MFLHLSVILRTGGGGVWQPPPRGKTPPGQTPPPPQETATAADGTHPTGMHSCYYNGCQGEFFLVFLLSLERPKFYLEYDGTELFN